MVYGRSVRYALSYSITLWIESLRIMKDITMLIEWPLAEEKENMSSLLNKNHVTV